MEPERIQGIFDACESKGLALGLFDAVNMHEPARAPGRGITFALWVEAILPVPASSGLRTTDAVLLLFGRTYRPAFTPNLDIVEPALLTATAAVINAFSGNFQLDPSLGVRKVDLLGASGNALGARAGYLTQDHKPFRIYNIQIPIICNDAWEQVA